LWKFNHIMKRANPKPTKRKDKNYIPNKQLSPVELSKRITSLNGKIEKNNSTNDLREKALYNYIQLMTNFASHDIKNAVHNLDGYISTLNIDDVQQEDINAIKVLLEGIRKTIKDFTSLAPDQTKNAFKLFEFCNSIELLNRGHFNDCNIKYEISYSKTDETIIEQSLHNLIQITNNLIINSIKALEKTNEKLIIIEVNIIDDTLQIVVKDNGCGVDEFNKDKIFDLRFSTTGGSGIGLAHAKFIIDDIPNAKIYFSDSDKEFTTFNLLIPTK
jgi:signal transduction histidine kinase